MEIYAIGHSNYTLERFMNIIKGYNINCIADIRTVPYSKYNIQYNKEAFQAKLKLYDISYVYLGDELGVKRKDKKSYNNEGYADFDKVIKEPLFKVGIERLKIGIEKGFKIAIMGAVQDPIRCPRAILIGRELVNEGIDVKYIMHEGTIKHQDDIEKYLIDKYFGHGYQMSLESISSDMMTYDDMIEQGYRMANKEIGYRIEHIKRK